MNVQIVEDALTKRNAQRQSETKDCMYLKTL